MNTFETCADFVLQPTIEGGLSDHHADPGGRTNMGVTQRRLDGARIDHPELHLPRTVDELTRPQVVAIYRVCEWAWIRGDKLPPPIALLMFDCAVNCGAETAIRLLQGSLRVKRDGKLGPITIAACRKSNARSLALELAAQRGNHYASLDKLDDVFGLGWMRRLFACYTLAINLGDTPCYRSSTRSSPEP